MKGKKKQFLGGKSCNLHIYTKIRRCVAELLLYIRAMGWKALGPTKPPIQGVLVNFFRM
jgi:hypothetical protein